MPPQVDKKIAIVAVAIVLLMTALGGALWFFWPQAGPSWKKTTTPYDLSCKKDCIEIAASLPHFNGVRLMVNPKVDDPVAQWGHCIDSVMQCLSRAHTTANDKGKKNAPLPVRTCVAQSACPQSCKARFADKSAGVTGDQQLLDVFEAQFVAEGAYCLPPKSEEAER